MPPPNPELRGNAVLRGDHQGALHERRGVAARVGRDRLTVDLHFTEQREARTDEATDVAFNHSGDRVVVAVGALDVAEAIAHATETDASAEGQPALAIPSPQGS